MTYLKQIMQHPRVRLAFNSSIMRKNILPIIAHMFSECNENDLFTDHMFQLFDQEYSKEDPEVTDEKYGRIRDLP